MIRAAALAAAAVMATGLAWGCSHTQTTGDNAPSEASSAETHGHETPPTDKPRARAAAAAGGGSGAPSHTEPPTDKPAREPPPLATSPAGLLAPGAVKTIQEKLAAAGYLDGKAVSGDMDASTRAAIRKLQRESDLPATGVPDAGTVRKLGLDPDRVFKHAE